MSLKININKIRKQNLKTFMFKYIGKGDKITNISIMNMYKNYTT